jgi:hypothetical protein
MFSIKINSGNLRAFLDKSIQVRVKSRTLNKKGALAEIAQLVEHTTENRGVPSPILGLGTQVRMV